MLLTVLFWLAGRRSVRGAGTVMLTVLLLLLQAPPPPPPHTAPPPRWGHRRRRWGRRGVCRRHRRRTRQHGPREDDPLLPRRRRRRKRREATPARAQRGQRRRARRRPGHRRSSWQLALLTAFCLLPTAYCVLLAALLSAAPAARFATARRLRRRCGLLAVRVGEAPHPGPPKQKQRKQSDAAKARVEKLKADIKRGTKREYDLKYLEAKRTFERERIARDKDEASRATGDDVLAVVRVTGPRYVVYEMLKEKAGVEMQIAKLKKGDKKYCDKPVIIARNRNRIAKTDCPLLKTLLPGFTITNASVPIQHDPDGPLTIEIETRGCSEQRAAFALRVADAFPATARVKVTRGPAGHGARPVVVAEGRPGKVQRQLDDLGKNLAELSGGVVWVNGGKGAIGARPRAAKRDEEIKSFLEEHKRIREENDGKKETVPQRRQRKLRTQKPRTATKKAAKSLRVLQLNCRGLKSKRYDVQRAIEAHAPDIILLQETWLTDDDKPPRFNGYDAVHRARPDYNAEAAGKGGLLTLIREGLPWVAATEDEAQALDRLQVWCGKTKMQVSTEKTEYIMFRRKQTPRVVLTYGGQPLPAETHSTPPWTASGGSVTFCTQLARRVKRTDPPEQRRAAVQETLAKLPPADLDAFTDGSAQDGIRRGGSGYVVYTKTGDIACARSVAAGLFCSSYRAELVAMR
eukprot:gene13113-18449_t